jgi:hypothetical protein
VRGLILRGSLEILLSFPGDNFWMKSLGEPRSKQTDGFEDGFHFKAEFKN